MILMILRKNVFKEIILPKLDNMDYQIFIDKNSFEVHNSFYITLEVINRKWRININNNLYQLIHHKKSVDFVELNGGEIVTLKTAYDDVIKIITFDNELSLLSFKKYNIIRNNKITVGKAEDNTIKYEFMNLVSKSHCTIVRDYDEYRLYDLSRNGVFVNHRRIQDSYVLKFGDIIEIFGLRIIYLGEIIAVGSCVNSFAVSENLKEYVVPAFEQSTITVKHSDTYFNRSPRVFPSISTEKIVIEPPTNLQVTKKRSMIMTIGPSFTMAIPMLLGCVLMIISTTMAGGTMSAFMYTGIVTALGSAILGSLWAFLNIKETQKREIADEEQRFNMYGNYLIEMSDYIKDRYIQNYNAMMKLYPSSSECCAYNENSPELWNRNISHSDFLFYRLGLGDVDFQMDIEIPKEKFSIVFDSLKDKPAMLYENFKTLKNVPVGVNFAEHNIYGLAGGRKKNGVYDIVNNIILQISATTSYTDVKIAFCFNKKKYSNTSQWDYIKWLPHIWSENRKMRYFATDEQEKADVFFELSNIIRQRAEKNSSLSEKKLFHPHYFLFLSDISMLDGELISKYVFDTGRNLGLTTFIMTDFYQNLPNACENIIQNDDNFCGSYNVLDSYNKVLNITFDKVIPDELMSFAKRLSGITVRENEDDTSIASSLDFFEMYNAESFEDFHIAEQWRKNRTYNTMRALIGKKAGGADCYLDIHEKYHGPHGLVAGTTGSGKSELIQTFMLSLAINYSPDDIAFFVIDFKGGGMANLFSDLPHMAGQISNLSGNQIGRAMISIKSENLRRQKIFSEYGVNNINNYTRLYKSGEAALPIPHLIIVIDEFAELKKEEPDFMRELISVAQVGRSLGVHLILATQKPSGTVDDNIWSNAKFRLCLRVQDRQDSNDMLHKPDAAYITQAGRCYLQVGNDEIYELFQSGWSGAVYDNGTDGGKNEIATMITTMGKAALVGSHTKIKRKEQEKIHWYLFLCNTIKDIFNGKNNNLTNENSIYTEYDVAEKVIKTAQENGYNIGSSNSEIRSVLNFIHLMPDNTISQDESVKFIVNKAAQKNIKLPEIKEKTQLEALVEYIVKVAKQENYNSISHLWMPLLKKEVVLGELCEKSQLFDENGWKEKEKWSLDAVVGIYDDPQNQTQLPFSVNFAENGHLAVCGTVVSGKSTFLQTLIFSLSIKYSPDFVNFYILDFSGGMLSTFEKLPHTGGVIKENDIDKTGKFFNMITSLIEERKRLFNGGNFSQYVKVHGIVIPSIIIVIDNFAGFKEKTENAYEDILIHLAREGVSYGIFLVMTSAGFGMAEIQNRIGDNIRTVISLEMGDKFKYMDILRTTHIDVLPESGIKGRGIGFVEGRLLEFQTAVSVRAEDDYKRSSLIENICVEMSVKWTGKRAKSIPHIPENPLYDDISQCDDYKTALEQTELLPYAYRFEDASVYSVNLKNTYCYTISGKKRTGKTNVLKLLMFVTKNKKAKTVVIEKDSAELKAMALSSGSEYISNDEKILQYFQSITADFVERNKLKKQLMDKGMSDEEIFDCMQKKTPIFIFIADVCSFINTIYHPEGNIGNMSGFFENIFEKGFLHNIFFIGCVNTDETSSVAGLKAYQCFISYKTGVHLGGNVAAQRIFSFQNIHYSKMSKSSKKGEGLVPSNEDDTVAEKIIIPLVGGKQI